MTVLMIVESPHKAKEIGKFLGAGYDVRASYGHVRDLPPKGQEDGEIVVGIGRDFSARYIVGERSRGAVKKLKDAAKRADRVVLATDPDREGEAIAWHLKQVLGLRDVDRVTYQEISEKAVRAALANPRRIDMDLVKAQEARRLLDRMVGYTVSPILSAQSTQSLSAGRVQTPALRLVVEREREIAAFVPQKHFGAEVGFEGGWKAQWMTKLHLREGEEYWLDGEIAAKVAQSRLLKVDDYADGQAREAPPAPFTTSTLQQEASKKFDLKVKEVMDAAQGLFDSGHITYHRTDSPNFMEEGHSLIRAYAVSAGLPLADAPRTWKSKAGAQEGHEAIRPVDLSKESAGGTDAQRKIYQLIRRRALASQMIDAEYATRTARLEALDVDRVNGKAPKFTAKGRVLTNPGWREVYGSTVDDEVGDDAHSNPIPRLEIGSEIRATSGRRLDKATKPPQRFTEAGLVKELEARGIGRPSTYASIIGNISGRNYIEATGPKGKYLAPSKTGCAIVDALAGKCQFADYEFTANIETELDEVAAGQRQYKMTLQTSWRQLESEIGGLKVSLPDEPKHSCPECGQMLRRRKGKKGFFWGCSGYPDCNVTLPDARGKPGEKAASSNGKAGGPSVKQLEFAESVATASGVDIPDEARADGRKLSAWIDQHKSSLPAKGAGRASKGRKKEAGASTQKRSSRSPAPPSERQMGYAEKIAQSKGLVIPSSAIVDRRELSKWIDEHG
jgi:DNA topoisomerase-1